MQSHSWQSLVTEPAEKGYFGEAFASADALIDDTIETCLRCIYSSNECQDLINELHYQRSRANFDGLVILEILKSKTLLDESLIDKVRHFKKARNLVLHDTQGEYALVVLNPHITYATQEEFDAAAAAEAFRWLSVAQEIYRLLNQKMDDAVADPAKFFSSAFYKANPRGKMIAKKFPAPPKPQKVK